MCREISPVAVALAAMVFMAAASPASERPPSTPDRSVPGKLVIDEPTFVCLSVQWLVSGDENRNAVVEFHYRKAGELQWREAMPLWRVDSTGWINKVPHGQTLFAGSIFNLDQGTAYEIKLNLHDPDGGDTEEIVTATTRVEPVLPSDGRVRYVTAGDGGGTGAKDDPFKGLAAADAAAEPGDIMQLAPGTYKGTWTLTRSGSEGKPIVWLGPPGNSAIIDGSGAEWAVVANGLSHVWFWRLSICNAETALTADQSSYLVMRYCSVRDADCGFVATRNPLRGNAVLDSTFTGRVPWTIDGARLVYPNIHFNLNGARYDFTNMVGVDVSGEGIVVAYNRMTHWGDGIHGSGNQPKCANDFYNNEISESSDDGIECDMGAQNIRCFSNRITNCFQGVSAQPVQGGPCYIFRNALYNMDHCPFKLENRPHGVLLVNNTTVRSNADPGPMLIYGGGTIYRVLAANNLFVGGSNLYALSVTPGLEDASFDYNGYAGGPFDNFARWNGGIYKTLADFRNATGQEKHAVLLPVKGLFASGVMLPQSPDKPVDVLTNDLRIAPGSAAVDAGAVFPGITDGFTGKTPDLGAYELGSALPHYGPRPEK